MGQSSVQVANERVKMAAGVLFNSGAALAAAAIVKVYSELAVDLSALIWTATAVALMYLGWLTLSLLEQEDLL